jgi:hypothetical protein
MRRALFAFALAVLMLGPLAAPAAAKCPTCFDGLSLQTPDGQPWSDGKPVTLVVSARRGAPGAEFPATGLAVVMRTDGDRTKCLDVPLKLVSQSGDSGLYAGVFYPFRAATYDGKLQLGDNTFDIRFDVRAISATTTVAKTPDLPVGSVEEPYATLVLPQIGTLPLLGLALAFWLAIAAFLHRRAPRVSLAS